MTPDLIEPDWPAPPNVRALCTTRSGGISERPFDSLNLGDHVGDQPRCVQANRQRLSAAAGLPADPVWLDQQHGCTVVCLDQDDDTLSPAAADAAFATRPGRVCAILTADCLPLLICDERGTRVAAIHAGWRGLAAGIIETAVGLLEPGQRRLYAWLGPAIGAQAYEIDAVVRSQLLAADPHARDAFLATRPGHWNADLYELARRRLQRAGVDDIFGGDFCTYTESGRFYSYRRDGQCGRMASLIWLAA